MNPKYLLVISCHVIYQRKREQETYPPAHFHPSFASIKRSTPVEELLAKADTAPATIVTTSRRPENSDIRLNASSGRRMTVDAITTAGNGELPFAEVAIPVPFEDIGRGVTEMRS